MNADGRRPGARVAGALAFLAALWTAGCRDAPRPADAARVDSLFVAADESYGYGDFPAATAAYENAVELARRFGDRGAEARGLTSLGLAAWRSGDYTEAQRLGEEALAFKIEAGLDTLLWRSYNALGLLAYSTSRYFDAVDLHARAVELAESSADTVQLAKSWSNLALAHTELGDFSTARRLHGQAIVAARAVADPFLEGRTLNQLGVLEVRVGEPILAARTLRRALHLARRTDDPVNALNTLGQLGTAYAAMGQPGRAIAHLDTALALSRELGLRQEEASNVEHLAEMYREGGEFRRALELYAEAEVMNEELGLEDEAAANLRSEAEIYAVLGNREAAGQRARTALEIHRRLGNDLEALSDELLLAELLHADGQEGAAATHLLSAMELRDRLNARSARAAVALTAARIADREGDPAEVLEVLGSNGSALDDIAPGAAWEAHTLIARAFERRSMLDSAVAAGRRAVESLERVRGGFTSRLLRTSYAAEREVAYVDLVRVLRRLERNEEAFEVADGVRGRALLEHLSTTPDDGEATVRELAEEERHLAGEVEALELQLRELEDGTASPVAVEEARANLRRLRESHGRSRSGYAAAFRAVEERLPKERALLAGGRPSARDVRRALRPGEVILEYLVTPGSVLAFVVLPDSVHSIETPIDQSELATRVRVAHELSRDMAMDPAAAAPALAALYRILVEPAASAGLLRDAETLIVVPHAVLAYVPFAALRGPDARYLVRDFALLNLPSAAALPALRATGPIGGWDDGPGGAFAPFPDELPATQAEARAVRRAFPSVEVREGHRATEAEFRRALGETAIVHAATHGILNTGNPMFSRLELSPVSRTDPADDGRFEVHELVSMPVRAALVFLSGCETGAGTRWSTTFGRGEDYTTLARAFLYAGAANVVATLWRVEDEGAARFASIFYEHLRASGPVDALAAAQRRMMDDPRYSSPYYWAAYNIAGGGRETGAQGPRALTVLDGGR